MSTRVNRQTVDLSPYPDLVVIYLGMRVNRLYGLRTLMGYGPRDPEVRDATARRSAAPRVAALVAVPYASSACASTGGTCRHCWRGPGPNRTGCGGGTFCATAAEPDSGTKRICSRAGMEAVLRRHPRTARLRGFAPVHPARGS